VNAFGYLFLLGGVLLIRQVVVGRVDDIPDDARDLFNALLAGDSTAVGEVMKRRGENVTVAGSTGSTVAASYESPTGETVIPATVTPAKTDVLVECVRLGNAATGYVLSATGPDYYDCSGLVWRAARNVGVYKGGRFTTSSFEDIAGGWCQKVSTPAIGDIVLWEGDHMGMLMAPNTLYSARSPSKGIGQSTVSGDSSYFGRQPTYWRVK
jgi:cell wall-associated NlpC family hydrolase